jgi:hypothetical protein
MRKLLSILALAALVAAGFALSVGGAAAVPLGPVDPSIPDGSAGSLRDVLDNASNGDSVELVPGATYLLTQTNSGNGLTWNSDLTINGHGATILQTIDEIVMNPLADTVLNDLTITGGHDVQPRPGGGIHLDADVLTLNRVALVGNQTCGDGGGIFVDDSPTEITINQSTIANNSAAGDGGAIELGDGASTFVKIVNSTITGNSAGEVGGIDATDGGPLDVVYSTITDNTTGATGIACAEGIGTAQSTDPNGPPEPSVHAFSAPPANLAVGRTEPDNLNVFGSVIAQPHGGENCSDASGDPLTTTVSTGYNFSDDASCGLGDATDKPSAGDPLLGALAANGGLGQTRLPQAGSPLIDAIPNAACSAGDPLAVQTITTDERGIARPTPAGGACDIGAVEVLPAVAIAPRFTG